MLKSDEFKELVLLSLKQKQAIAERQLVYADAPYDDCIVNINRGIARICIELINGYESAIAEYEDKSNSNSKSIKF